MSVDTSIEKKGSMWLFRIPDSEAFPRHLDIDAPPSLADFLAYLTIAANASTYEAIAKRPHLYGEGLSAHEANEIALGRLRTSYGVHFDSQAWNHVFPAILDAELRSRIEATDDPSTSFMIAVSTQCGFLDKQVAFRVIGRNDSSPHDH